jgi:hypothetical protein
MDIISDPLSRRKLVAGVTLTDPAGLPHIQANLFHNAVVVGPTRRVETLIGVNPARLIKEITT